MIDDIANPKYFVFIYFNLSNNFFFPYVTLLHRRRKKFKPSISVVFHHDDGQTEVETVDLTETLQQDQEELQTDGDDEFMPELEDESEGVNTDGNTSLYYRKVQKKQKAWEDLRCESLRKTIQYAGQISSSCVMCGEEGASLRCQECAYGAMFCQECALRMHTRINLYHNVEVLRVCYLCFH